MNGLGFKATLLNIRGSAEWWDDCQPLKKMFNVAHLEKTDLSGVEPPYDLLLEVGLLTLKPEQRKAIAKTAIWVIRKPFVLGEIEASIFPTMIPQRNLDGIKEAWLLKDACAPDDVSMLETMTRVPVRQVPFLWSPLPAEAHHRSLGAPFWRPALGKKFLVHMVDTNTTSSSSSTIPLVAMREAARRKAPIESWRLHNGETIAKSKFFRDNVLKHSSDLVDISGQCVGRQRAVEWTTVENTLAIAHLRFTLIRPVLLDMAWVGVPIVHNSPVFREIGCGAEKLYYSNNSIDELVQVIQDFHTDLKTGHCSWILEGKGRREALLKHFSPISPRVRAEWIMSLQECLGVPLLKQATQPAQETPAAAAAPTPTPLDSSKTEYSVVFCNMWDAFQPDYNFFTLLLNEAGKSMTPPRIVKGYAHESWDSAKDPDLVIFGPFGDDWRSYAPTVPRVHFTGENTPPIRDPTVRLNLGFMNMNLGESKDYLRLPLWMTEINWFGADVERLVNPKPLPLELCTRTNEATLEARKKFCSFVVTNPRNPIRNQAFHWLLQYKQVDSGGLLYNTIGNELMALRGGGGGELKKIKFNMDYKFALTYENSKSDGYTTEKYLHAKVAGCVPIYWGDPMFQRDFDLAGCIDARDVRTPEELIALVKKVDADDEEWKRRAAVPALDAYRVDLVRRTMSECAGRIYGLFGADDTALKSIPRFLGCEPGSAAAKAGMEYFEKSVTPAPTAPLTAALLTATPLSAPPQTHIPIVTTYTSFQFLGSLQQWLSAIGMQARVLPDLKAIVFMANDVPT